MSANLILFQILAKREPVYVISHERSGTHFAINNLYRNAFVSQHFCYVGDWMGPYSEEATKYDHIVKFAADWPELKKSGGIVKSHCCASLFKSHFPRAKVIYVLRDPRDTLVSFFHYLNKDKLYETNPMLADQRCGSFSEFLRRPASDYLRNGFFDAPDFDNVVGRWASHVRGWLSVPGVCVVRYEELKNHYRSTVLRVCWEVGVVPRLRMSPVPISEKNAILPRKGVVGDWKNHFSKEDEEFLQKVLDQYKITPEGILK